MEFTAAGAETGEANGDEIVRIDGVDEAVCSPRAKDPRAGARGYAG